MKPATEQQKAQVYFMEAREQMELNVTRADPGASAFQHPDERNQSDYAKNTTAFD